MCETQGDRSRVASVPIGHEYTTDRIPYELDTGRPRSQNIVNGAHISHQRDDHFRSTGTHSVFIPSINMAVQDSVTGRFVGHAESLIIESSAILQNNLVTATRQSG